MTSASTPPLRTGGAAWGPQRVRLGLSLRELSRRSGVDKAILSMAENGRLIPTAAEWDAVMAALRAAEEATP
jgi:predicted transcriptional regulator